MAKTLSCDDLHHSLFAGPGVLRNCCKRFFVDGKIKGDVEICKVTSADDLNPRNILKHKKELYEAINNGEETDCTGCPWLKKDEWPALESLEIRHVSVEVHSVCNLKCTYCSDTYYGGKTPNYSIEQLCDELNKQGSLAKNISFVWGGGEPVMLKSFDKVFSSITDKYQPVHNNVFTNAIIFNKTLNKYLADQKATITVSIDAGTPETYKAIRGSDQIKRVFENLKKYHQNAGERVTLKYILMPENISKDDLAGFIKKIEAHQLAGCSFQISTDYKGEQIEEPIAKAAVYLLKELKKLGSTMINFDDHLRPKINQKRELLVSEITSGIANIKNVVIWGAGDYSRRMLEESDFFKDKKVKYFVDKRTDKQGKKIQGYEIKSPQSILSEKEAAVFIGSTIFYREIYNELIGMGFPKNQIIDANVF